jgi:hypothetical protein
MKLIKARAEGKTYAQAAIAAGYPEKNARQSGFQTMQQIRGRVPDLLDKHGLSEGTLLDEHLRPRLNAQETAFFQKDGKVRQRVNVAAWAPGFPLYAQEFELHGSYAPRDPKEAEQFGVKVIVLDMSRPPSNAIDVTPRPAMGNGRPVVRQIVAHHIKRISFFLAEVLRFWIAC